MSREFDEWKNSDPRHKWWPYWMDAKYVLENQEWFDYAFQDEITAAQKQGFIGGLEKAIKIIKSQEIIISRIHSDLIYRDDLIEEIEKLIKG